MNHRTKQALSWLLSLALMLSLIPNMSLTAYAEASGGTIGTVAYTIDDSGVLTVGSGEFTIENWASAFGTGGTSNTPNDTAKSIKSVSFASGATLTSTSSKQMFYNWTALESANLKELQASSLLDISMMFQGCVNLASVTFGSGFDTSRARQMYQMFQGCSSLTELDLSTFKNYTDTTGSKKLQLYHMFYGCSNLTIIRVRDDWNPTYVSANNGKTYSNAEGNDVFTGCEKLIGGNGTKCTGFGDYTYAVIDGKDGKSGYFTSASAAVEHRHEFSYSASGSTLTATCSASDCGLTDNKVELTLTPPAKTVYGDSNSAAATLEGGDAFNEATSLSIGSWQTYEYYKKGSDNLLGSAPTTPGEYTVKVTISGVAGGSYNLTADYTIAQKEVGLTWADTEFNYDGLQHSPTVTATGLVGNDQCTVTVIGEGTEIGTYTATASGLSNEWYKLPDDVEQQFSIVAKVGGASYVIDDGVLTVKSGSFTGEQWNAAFAKVKDTITRVSFENGAELTGSATRMFMDWSALASVDFSNLTASDVKDMSQMFQGCVSLTELDLSIFSGYTGAGTRSLSQTFSGCSNLVTIRVSDNWNVDKAEGSDTFSGCTELIGGNGTNCTGIGDYTKAVIDTDGQPGYLTSTSAEVHWHKFTYSASGSTLTATCSVDGCNLENHQVKLTLNAPEKTVYDDGESAEATLEGKDAFKAATGVSAWNVVSYYKKGISASMTAPTTPGEYTAKVTISNVAGGPYELSVDYTIEQKEIGLTWGETTFHYDGNPHAPTVTATGLVGNDKCDVIVTGEQTAIGNYTATASGLSNEWYKLPENNTVEFDIEGWLGTARYTIESSKAPSKSKMLLKATGASNSDDDYKLNDGNYSITNGVLTVYSSSGTSTFTLDDWRLAFANENFIRNYRDNITRVVFSHEGEKSVKLTGSAEGMFRDWAGLESIDFSGLDTSEVTWMQNMFSGCVSLTELDLSPLNTKSVQNMANMFYKCSKLKKITVGENWQTASSTSHMFSGCNALDGGAGTRYQALFGNYIYTDDDPNNPTLPDVSGTYARLDGGENDPGFFYNEHKHQLSYTVDPDAPWKITATCSADKCYLGDSNTHSVSISLVKPTLYVYWMDELNKKDGEYDKGASPFATLTMQNVGAQTLTESSTAADPDGKINGVSFSVATFNDANTAAPTFEELTGATIGKIEYYEKGSDTKLDKAPTDAGTYTAKVTIGGATASVDYRIFKRFHSPVLKSPVKNASFDFASATEQDLITVEENAIEKVDNTDTSTFEFALGEKATTIPTDGWSKEIPKASGEGPFYVFYRVAGDKNHGNAMESEFPNKSGYANTTNPEHASNSYKPAYSVIVVSNTAPIPPMPNELTYNGNDQVLVTAGSSTTGKMQYALGTDKTDAPTDGWSDTIPTGKEPAVYYVWYRVVNANDTSSVINQPICVQVPLGKATPTVTPPSATATYGQTLAKLSLTNPAGNPEGAWTWVNPGTSVGNVGTKTFKAKFTPTDTAHYKTVEADVTVTVGKADPTVIAPTGVTATYGQTLADVALPNPQSNIPGIWAWVADGTTDVGTVGNQTFKANFTPNDTDNYNSKNNVDVSVQVDKAANPATVNATAAVKTGGTINLSGYVSKNEAAGDVSYEISGNAKGCTLSEGSLQAGQTPGTVIVNVTIAADDNYEALPATPITVTISAKDPQTISADNLTVAYGDTGKKVSASVTVPTEGGGEISYAVKSGSEKYIAIDAEGNLTINAVPLDGDKAYVIVTAAETSEYAVTTKEVTVTINRKLTDVAAAPEEITGLTYSGRPQELVTVGTASSGCQLRYALGADANNAPTEGWSATIPTATNAGTYYVWYYNAVQDNNHKDSEPEHVEVKVAQKTITVTADDKSVIYGNPIPALTYTATGLVDGDTLTGALACEVAEKPDAGEYNIKQGTLAVSANYNLSFTGSTLKVLQAAQSRPESGEGYSISNAQVITIESGYEVINDQGVAVANGATVELNKTYSIRKAGNDNYTPSPYTDFTVTSVTIRATASPAAGGGITGASDYMVGASVTLTATPNSGYKFKEWLNESGISIGTDSTYTFKAAKNISITAVFLQTEKTIVQIPTATNHTYDGTLKTGVIATDNCIVQNGAKTGAGNYTATATLTNTTEFVWSDGTSAPKSIAWSIYKASQPRPIVTVDDGMTSATVSASGYGKVQYKLADATTYTMVNELPFEVTANNTYHVRYAGDDNYLPSSASIVPVGNPYIAPTVKTNAVSALTATSATISGKATNGKDTGKAEIQATLKLRYGTNANLSGATETEGTLTGLTPNTTYYYQAYATFTNGTEQTIEGEILSFKTPASAPAATGRIDVSVSTSDDKTVYATIEQGNDVIAASEATAVNNTTHLFQFNNLSNGTYNVVVRTEDGKYTETHTITITADASTQATSFTILGGNGTLEAVVDIKTADTPKVAADGIRDTITEEEATLIQNGELSVKTALDVEKKTSDSAVGASEIAAIAGSDKLVGLFLDLSLIKTTSELDSGTGEVVGVMEENIGAKNDVVLQIAIPYADVARNGLEVYRYHGNTASTLKALTAKPSDGFVDGTFFADTANKYLFIYAKEFSTYAVGYTTATQSSGGSTSGGSHSGGSSSSDSDDTRYKVTAGEAQHGTVSVSSTSTSSGTKVTITVKPDTGYAVDTVTVTGTNGKNVTVTKVNDTTYTYIQPGMDVKTDVTFRTSSGTDALAVFSDVNASDWYADAVRWAVENGVMNGVGGGKFNPGGETSRGMVVTMLWRLEGSPAYAGASEFADVKNEDWYGQAVRWASAEGIVTGYEQDGGKVFNPNGAVTREQLATMLYRYAQHKGQGFTGLWSFPLDYPDASSVSEWAYEAMCWMTMNGVINGMDGKLAPASGASRAQVATMLMRYCTSAGK